MAPIDETAAAAAAAALSSAASSSSSASSAARVTIFIVSDSVGETAELVARAAASQFTDGAAALPPPDRFFETRRFPHVENVADIDRVLAAAAALPASSHCLIAHTLVYPDLRSYLKHAAASRGLAEVDLIGPMIDSIAAITGTQPRLEPGLVRRLDEEYFRRVEAIEFAVRFDDGKDLRGLEKADVVIIGVSRTSKTPLSMYLAHQRIKVANVPLVPEVPPPAELFALPRGRVVGLTIDIRKLIQIREERLRAMGLPPTSDYAADARVLAELEYAEGVMRRLGCPVIDVTNRAVEETANKVMEIINRRDQEDDRA